MIYSNLLHQFDHNQKIEKFEQDRIDAMKRRAERAENKIAELEKQVSEQYEKSNSLKRKVQEETMVRKFKERRLGYLQTNKRSSKFLILLYLFLVL